MFTWVERFRFNKQLASWPVALVSRGSVQVPIGTRLAGEESNLSR